MNTRTKRIGFVSTRLAGVDGVSLEAAKWANVLTELGHECFALAGETDWPSERAYVVDEARFDHPEQCTLHDDLFNDYDRSPQTSRRVEMCKNHLKRHLSRFVRAFQPDMLIAENVLSLPMNIPLGLALTEFVAETGMPVIAHHHDFTWERERFAINAASDYLRASFSPTLPSIYHVVINSFAAHQLAMRTSERSTLIPNVMDFDSPPPPPDSLTATLRSALGIGAGEFMLLQPTRIVPRKRIEQSIELARRLGLPCALVISHASGDEGHEYEAYLRDYAKLMGVRVIFAADLFGHERERQTDGRRTFSLADAYHQADLVTYPSAVEGFGNAFLETIYYRRPIIMRNYEIFRVDLKPKGFHVLIFSDFIPQHVVDDTRALLTNPALVAEMVDQNYTIARRYYSYQALANHLVVLLNTCLGT
jgi:hypothetical protein